DAATTLVGLNALWRAHLSTQTLSELAAELGSDVPFFIRGGAAVMRGRGDQLAPLPARTDQWLVLLVPPHTLVDKTRQLYAALESGDFSEGAMTERAAERLVAGQPLDEYELVNGFERAARRVFPGLDQMWRSVEALAKRRFFLSGAGPAVFALAASRDDARQTVGRLSQVAASTYAVRTVKHARASLRRSPIEYP
ncbi:MAG: 4-diphosphocytidyl-2C-methyl-D-erythritol kinase, partial [Chloroflexi bacterium]|nr:4-diphosphocytidyl-2C-methyl-D-erythritol kinase [Chloroflexota bacterium]